MTWEEIVALMEQGEGQAVEFEKQLTGAEDIARELVAFSNSDGGKLIIGLDDKNRHLLGVKTDDGVTEWIREVAHTKCQPSISPVINVFEKNGRSILLVTIPEGDEKPYKTDDICYIRDGAISRPAREKEEEEIKSPWHGHGLNKRQKRVLFYMHEHSSITNREYREMFNVSHKTAHIELTLLADKGLAVTQGAGRSTCYTKPS